MKSLSKQFLVFFLGVILTATILFSGLQKITKADDSIRLRVDSIAALINYLPDNYRDVNVKTDRKLSEEELQEIKKFLRKVDEERIKRDKRVSFILESSLSDEKTEFNLYTPKDLSGNEYILVDVYNYYYGGLITLGFKPKDGNFVFFLPPFCVGSKDFFQFIPFNYSKGFPPDDYKALFYYYLKHVNIPFLKSTDIKIDPSEVIYSRAITTLFSSYFWLYNFDYRSQD